MEKIVSFIHYFPGKGGFIIPIYSDNENKYFLYKLLDGVTKTKAYFDIDSQEEIKLDKINLMEKKERNHSGSDTIEFLHPIEDVDVSGIDTFLYAFYFENDKIILADRVTLSEILKKSIHLFEDDTDLKKEIELFTNRKTIPIKQEYKKIIKNIR